MHHLQKTLDLLMEGYVNKPEIIKDKNLYWNIDSSKGTPSSGFKVPKYSHWDEAEELIEKARLEVNPTAPSRRNCIFLCPSEGNSWCSYRKEEDVVEVVASGNSYIGDYEYISRIFNIFRGRESNKSIHEYDLAKNYWTYRPNTSMELVLDGEAYVI